MDQPAQYELRVKGILDTKWASWFDGFDINHKAAETILTGQVRDQAALHGILARIRDLGLTILCIKRLENKYLEEQTSMTNWGFPKHFPELETERTILRKITSEDTDAVFRNFSDPEIARCFFEHPLTDVKQVGEFIEQFNVEFEQGEGLTWAIVLKDTNACIGTCGYGYVEVGSQGKIGFDLAKEYWNKGIMSECLKAILDYGFSVLGLSQIEAQIFSKNDRAHRLLEKLSFQLHHITEDNHYYVLSSEDL